MVQGKDSQKTAAKLTVGQDDYMKSLKENILLYLADMNMSLNGFSEYVDIPYSTLNTIVYGSPKDVKLSTVVQIARQLNIALDELVGSQTMNPVMRESIRISHLLPEQALYLIRYLIRHQAKLHSEDGTCGKYISVLEPHIVNGVASTASSFFSYCIDGIPDDIKAKVYLGMEIPPGDYFMPCYMPGEIVLIASDREPHDGERCVVTRSGGIHIMVKNHLISDGIKKCVYSSILSKSISVSCDLIDDNLGYIVGFLNRNGSFGIR